MGLLAMSKPKATSADNNSSGMGLLLVLFPRDNKSTTTTIASKSLLSKAQSTISICALLLFITLLLFTLSTIPNTPSPPRFLLHKPNHNPKHHFALQRMGTLYRKGTRAMTDLLVCHVADETSQEDFRFFLRLLHRSGLTASTDVVFIFSSPSSSSNFSPILHQENEAFSSLLHLHLQLHSNSNSNSTFPLSRFFLKGTNTGETLWGNRNRSSNFTARAALSYGSVLSFDATELDPENSLAGFLDRVPLSLRRWACYPMLLGRVRRNFKHVMLVDARSVLILKDPLSRVRNRSPDSVLVFVSKADEHGKKTQSTTQRMILPAVVIGGARGVRRLANAVVVEVVRAAIQHKKKNSVSDSAVLSQLVNNEFMLSNKNVHLIASSESIPEVSSLAGHNSGGGAATSFSDYAIIQRGTSNHDLNSVIKKQLCSSVVDSSVYRDC